MKWCDAGISARGAIAIGINAVGFLAVGINTMGVISIGCNTAGIFTVNLGIAVGAFSIGIGMIFALWGSGMGLIFSCLPCPIGLGICPANESPTWGAVTICVFVLLALILLLAIRRARKKELLEGFTENRDEFLASKEQEIVDLNYLRRNPHLKGIVKGDVVELRKNGALLINVYEYDMVFPTLVYVKGSSFVQAEKLCQSMNSIPHCYASPIRVCFFTLTAIERTDLLMLSTDDEFQSGGVEIEMKSLETKQDDDQSTVDCSLLSQPTGPPHEYDNVVLECSDIVSVPFPENISYCPYRSSKRWIWQFWETPEYFLMWFFWVVMGCIAAGSVSILLQILGFLPVIHYLWYGL